MKYPPPASLHESPGSPPLRGALAGFGALFLKDLRVLRPVIVGLVLLNLIGTLGELAFNAPDETTPPGREMSEPVVALAMVALTLAAAFIGALVLFVGERESRTDAFIATLPVAQRTALLSKFLVLALAMLGSTWLSSGLEHGLALCNPDSVARRQLTFARFALSVGLGSWLAFVVAAHAVWLSWLGRMGWLVIALGTLGTGLLPRLDPRLGRFGLPQAISLEHHGVDPIVSWPAILLHSVLACAALWLGVRLWMTDRERAHQPRFPRLVRVGRIAGLGLGGAFAFLVVLGLALSPTTLDEGDDDDESDDGKAGAQSTNNRRKTVGRFTFTYRGDDEARAKPLMAGAEGMFERLQRWLGVTGPKAIVVDLTYEGVELGGLALGARMNIDIQRTDDADELAGVFLHELVHVFQNHLAGDERGPQEATLRFFSEGMAEHVSFALLERGETQRQGRRRAAWAEGRYRIRLHDLFDVTPFVTQFDERWLYDFGEIYAGATAKLCGRPALARVFRRLGEPSLPKNLKGEPLLRALLSEGACTLDAVQADVHAEFARLAADGATALPPVRARYQRTQAGSLEFELRLREDAPTDPRRPVRAVVMVRRDNGASPRDYVATSVELSSPSTRAFIEAEHLDEGRFQYRVGLLPPWGGGHVFTRWRTTTTR
ncbi:MAG TPA: ABC transporter permease [Polyangia bacterium]